MVVQCTVINAKSDRVLPVHMDKKKIRGIGFLTNGITGNSGKQPMVNSLGRWTSNVKNASSSKGGFL